jgi:pimeloyl-ACP methyl ester carboxylesterase
MEHAYAFGSSAQLVGILTDSTSPLSSNDTPILLLLNAGLRHRVGPFRLHVDLARELSGLGFSVFRFDLSGIGDSNRHKDNRSREEQILSDIREAMDFLSTRKGIHNFVVMGLCTGADNAHKISVRDERISGAVFLDGYCYPTAGFYLRRYGSKVLNPMAWWRRVMRLFIKLMPESNYASDEHDEREENYFWTLPPKQKTETELKLLVARGVKLLYVFSNGFISNYKDQFATSFKSLDFGNQLQVEFSDESEHLYPIIADRKRLIGIISDWLSVNYGGR